MTPRVQRIVGVLLAIVVALAVFAGTAVFATGRGAAEAAPPDDRMVARESVAAVRVDIGANARLVPSRRPGGTTPGPCPASRVRGDAPAF